jgi:Tol biopolymer transport system component
VQGCFGGNTSSNTPNTKTITTNSSGQQVGVNQTQNLFKGKIYFTIDGHLWVYNGDGTTRQLTTTLNLHSPAVSPNGKWIVMSSTYKNYSDIVYMSTSGGPIRTLLTGNGKFYDAGDGIIKSTYYWLQEPTWSADGSHVIFLSDLQKEDWYSLGGLFANAPFLDLQVFSVPFNNPNLQAAQAIAYASFGDGGDQDPSFQPGNPNELVYTHYAYDNTGTQQVIQIFLDDATAIADHPGAYTPTNDPGIAITPANTQNIEPAFSPDGKAIAYIQRESSSQMGLYIMPVPEGVTATPNDPATEQKALLPYKKSSHILSGEFISQPVWSPDGKQIVYISYNNESFDLWLANISVDPKTGVYVLKGNPIQLTTGGIDGNSRPFWTT